MEIAVTHRHVYTWVAVMVSARTRRPAASCGPPAAPGRARAALVPGVRQSSKYAGGPLARLAPGAVGRQIAPNPPGRSYSVVNPTAIAAGPDHGRRRQLRCLSQHLNAALVGEATPCGAGLTPPPAPARRRGPEQEAQVPQPAPPTAPVSAANWPTRPRALCQQSRYSSCEQL